MIYSLGTETDRSYWQDIYLLQLKVYFFVGWKLTVRTNQEAILLVGSYGNTHFPMGIRNSFSKFTKKCVNLYPVPTSHQH